MPLTPNLAYCSHPYCSQPVVPGIFLGDVPVYACEEHQELVVETMRAAMNQQPEPERLPRGGYF